MIVLAAVGVATAAAAGTKSSVVVPGFGFESTRTDCPKGTALAAQGFGTKDFGIDPPASTVVRIDSHRSGSGLASSATNFGLDAGTFDAYAYCSKAARKTKVVRDKQFVTIGTFGAAEATCPQGSVPVGGGFGAPGFAAGPVRVIALTSRRQGRAWRVEALAEGDDTARTARGGVMSGTLVAYAYCMKDVPKITIRRRSVAVDQSGLEAAVATCPKRRVAVGGGFDGNIQTSGELLASGTIVSRRAKRGRAWKIRAIGLGEAAGAKATAYAYCMKR